MIKTEEPFLKIFINIWGNLPCAAAQGSGQWKRSAAFFTLLGVSPSFLWLLPTNLYFEGSLQEILCFLQFFHFISVHIALLFPPIGSKSLG